MSKNKVPFNINEMNNKTLFLFTGLLVLIYYVFSTFSDGFYMHDEPMFYIYANEFWIVPKKYLLAFQKLGYVLFLSLPSLLGFSFLAFFNSLVSGLTVMYAYKILVKLRSKNSFLIFLLLGLQPLWFMLAFRNFSEFLVALLSMLVLWNHLNKRYIFAALLLSYAALTRQEYHIFVGLYFLVLIFKKQWLPAVLTGTFTILHNFMGYMLTDDILYLPNSVIQYSEKMTGTFPIRGFAHYFTMSNVVFGSVILVLFFSYLGSKILKKQRPNWYLLVPVIGIFFFNVYGANTIGGGNLRYLLPIGPMLAMLGVLAIDDALEMKNKNRLLLFLVPLLIVIGLYQTYDHDFMKLFEDGERYWPPFIVALILTVLIVLPLKQKHYMLSIAALTLIVAIGSVRTFPLNPEDATMKKAGKWFARTVDQGKGQGDNALIREDAQVAFNHILLSYFSEKQKDDFKVEPIRSFTKDDTDKFKKGDIVIWDSHYGYRPKLTPGSQPYDYYDKNPEYEKIQYFQSKDQRFIIVFFRKKTD